MSLPRPCLTCGRPGAGSYCAEHAPLPFGGPKPLPAARGYGSGHRSRAKKLRALRLPCCLCGGAIDYDAPSTAPASFAAHHLTRDKDGPLGATHRACNTRRGRPSQDF